MLPVQLGPPTARIPMLLKFSKDFSLRQYSGAENITSFSFLTGRKIWGHLFNHWLQVTSETYFSGAVTGPPRRLLEIAFSPFFLCFHSCIHTKFLSRCVLNRSALIASKFLQHDPFQTKQTNRPTIPKQPKVTGIARTQEQLSSQARFIPYSAWAGYQGWIMSLLLGVWVTAAAWISGFILGSKRCIKASWSPRWPCPIRK